VRIEQPVWHLISTPTQAATAAASSHMLLHVRLAGAHFLHAQRERVLQLLLLAVSVASCSSGRSSTVGRRAQTSKRTASMHLLPTGCCGWAGGRAYV
jgi:hypothetical protein